MIIKTKEELLKELNQARADIKAADKRNGSLNVLLMQSERSVVELKLIVSDYTIREYFRKKGQDRGISHRLE